jgi:hypothetical protein
MTEFSDISDAMEDILWNKGLLGSGSPTTTLEYNVVSAGAPLCFTRKGQASSTSPNQPSVKTMSDGRRYLE